MSDNDRTVQFVCGRAIGTATGWDQLDTFSLSLHDFKGVEGYEGPEGDICIFFGEGCIESYDEAGNVTAAVDLITAIKHCPEGGMTIEVSPDYPNMEWIQ